MKKLLLLLCTLLTGVSGAWADIYTVSLGSQVTDLATLSSDKYYVLKNYGSNRYNCYDATNDRLDAMVGINYACVVKLTYADSKLQIQQVLTGTYYQALSTSRVTLGTSPVDFTFNTDGVETGQFRFANGSYFMNRTESGNQFPVGVSNSMTGDYSRWNIYEVSVTSLVSDGNCYKIDFVSKDGTTKWGISASAPSAGAGTGSVFVAHEYTNEVGKTRWIFVNNTNGKYLAYKAEDTEFNINKPVHEFSFSYLTPGEANVTADADCTNKFFITATNRATNRTDAGCYILKEETGAFDTSSAPYYGGDYTSALNFTSDAGPISTAAQLAIGKFDALYAVKSYINTAANISALFTTSASTLQSDINAAATADAAVSTAETFLKGAEGRKFYALNNSKTEHYMNVTSSNVTATSTGLSTGAIMVVEYAGAGKYYIKSYDNSYYICAPTSISTAPATTSQKASAGQFYIGNYSNSTDNLVYFTTAKADGTTEAIHYNDDYANSTCGWQYSSPNSQWQIAYVTDADYTSMADPYSGSITYTLTDMNGATYGGTYDGTIYDLSTDKGTIPTLTGCDGSYLSNQTWNASSHTFTADITFPFVVSSNSKNNYTYIGSFAGDEYTTSRFCWYVKSSDATKVYGGQDKLPTNQSGENEKWEWSIIPTFSTGAFSFKIKNVSTTKYLMATASPGFSNKVTFDTETGTAFTFDNHRWKLPSYDYYLSQNSSSAAEQELGVYGTNGSQGLHTGNDVAFIEPADFTSLVSSLTSAYSPFSSYTIGTGLGEYSCAVSALETAITSAKSLLAGSSYAKAAQISSWTTTLSEGATSSLSLNLPVSGKFLRIKGSTTGKYICNKNEYTWSGYYNVYKNTEKPNEAIFYLQSSDNKNYLLSYGSGYYNNTDKDTWNWGLGLSNAKAVVFAQGNVGYYYVKTGGNVYFYDDDSYINRGSSNSGDRYNKWSLEYVDELPVTISAAKYATLCAPVALTIPSGVKAYYISDVTKTEATLTKLTGTIPADMPVILYADGLSETTTFNFPITTADAFVGTNILSGQAAAQNVAAGVAYTLQTASNEDLIVGFYPKAAGTIAGFRAYLLASELPADVKGLKFRFDDADGISTVQGSELMVNDPEIYNIAGQRISKLQKGVNIVNGKKVLVK